MNISSLGYPQGQVREGKKQPSGLQINTLALKQDSVSITRFSGTGSTGKSLFSKIPLLGGLAILMAPIGTISAEPEKPGPQKPSADWVGPPTLPIQPSFPTIRESDPERMLRLAKQKMDGLQDSMDRKEVRLNKPRKADVWKEWKQIYDLSEKLKDRIAEDANDKEITKLANELRHQMTADPSNRKETQRWADNTIRIASCSQEETAGFYKTVVPLGLSLEKEEIRTLYQAVAEVHRNNGKGPKEQPWPNESISELFAAITGFKTELFGKQTHVASTNFHDMGDVWSKDKNTEMKGKRKVLIFYNHEQPFQPELIGFIKKLQSTYKLSLGDYKPEDINDLVGQTESATMGDFIIICPKGKLGERRIEEGFNQLQKFTKDVPDGEVMVYVGAHGSYGAPHAGQEDTAILEGARIGRTHFKDITVDEHFWMKQAEKLKDFKSKIPWFFDTCHAGSMISKTQQKSASFELRDPWTFKERTQAT